MDSSHEAPLSRWTGEFLDADHEQAFQADAWPRLSGQLRIIVLIAGSVYIAALYLNWQGFGDSIAFRTMVALRLGTGIAFGGIALASRPSWPQGRVHVLFLVTILLMVTTRLVETHLAVPTPAPGAPGTMPIMPIMPILPVMPLIVFAVIAIPVRLAMVWSGVGSLLFLRNQVAVWGYDAPITQVLLLYLVLANGVGYVFRVAWNRITHRDFALRQTLEREVVERQRAEQEARRAAAAKGRFLAVMSHEIRTPLNSVLGVAQLLQETTLLPEQQRLLDTLARSGNQLGLLLDGLLDLARIEAGRLDLAQEPFSPADLLISVQAVLYPQARSKGLALALEHPAELPSVLKGDALRLQQVLINLVGNAVKFTERGEVVLSVAFSTVVDQPKHCQCTFSIRDTGPGLDEEARARIFAAFEQGDTSTRRRHGGVGLGLAISRELVAVMGGELVVESTPGQGSIFSFSLVLPIGETLEPIESHPARPLSILVVDDLEANLIVAKGLLASLGHRVQTVTTGKAVLGALQAETFDAVLLDLHMQDMDGLEVLQQIRSLSDRRLAGLPVFLMTADMEQTHVQTCLAAGMQGVLPKPIRKARLAALLAELAAPVEGPAATEIPLVDRAQVAQIMADLGPDAWAAGLCACRASADDCLKELVDGKALHRLAGLSGSYGMPRLHQLVRRAEALLAAGTTCPQDDLRTLVAASLAHLETISLAPSTSLPKARTID